MTFPERGGNEEQDNSNEGIDGEGGDRDSGRVRAREPVVTGEDDGCVEEDVGELTEEESEDGARLEVVGMSEDGVWDMERKKIMDQL